jgi:hypothetical protein
VFYSYKQSVLLFCKVHNARNIFALTYAGTENKLVVGVIYGTKFYQYLENDFQKMQHFYELSLPCVLLDDNAHLSRAYLIKS